MPAEFETNEFLRLGLRSHDTGMIKCETAVTLTVRVWNRNEILSSQHCAWIRYRKSFITVWRNILTGINIVNSNEEKNKLETDIEPASCDSCKPRVHFVPAEFRTGIAWTRSHCYKTRVASKTWIILIDFYIVFNLRYNGLACYEYFPTGERKCQHMCIYNAVLSIYFYQRLAWKCFFW